MELIELNQSFYLLKIKNMDIYIKKIVLAVADRAIFL